MVGMVELAQNYLMTPDLEESRVFYEEMLGLNPSRVGDSSVSYDLGDLQLKVTRDHPNQELEEYGLSHPREPRGEGAVFVVVLEDLDRAVEDAGTWLIWGPGDAPWGGRMALLESPAGYVFEVRETE